MDKNLIDFKDINQILEESNVFKFILKIWFYSDKIVYFGSSSLDKLELFKKNNYIFLNFYKKYLKTEDNVALFNKLLTSKKIFIDPQNFFLGYLRYKNGRLLNKILQWIRYLLLDDSNADIRENEKQLLTKIWSCFLTSNIKLNLFAKKKYWLNVLKVDGKLNDRVYFPIANFLSYLFHFSIKKNEVENFFKILGLDKFQFTKENIVHWLSYLRLFEFELNIDKLNSKDFIKENGLEKFLRKEKLGWKDLLEFFEKRSNITDSKLRKYLNILVKYNFLKDILYMKYLQNIDNLSINDIRYLSKFFEIGKIKKDFIFIEELFSRGLFLPKFLKLFYIYILNKIFRNYFFNHKNGKIAWNRFKFILLLYFSNDEKYFEFVKKLILFEKNNFSFYIRLFFAILLIILGNIWFAIAGIFLVLGDKIERIKIESVVKIETLKIGTVGLGLISILGSLGFFQYLKTDISQYSRKIFLLSGDTKFVDGKSKELAQTISGKENKKFFSIKINNLILSLSGYKIKQENKSALSFRNEVVDENKEIVYITKDMYLWNIVEKLVTDYMLAGRIRFENEIEKYKFIRKVIKNYVTLHIKQLRKSTYLENPSRYKWNILTRYLKTGTPIYLEDIKRIIEFNLNTK